MRDELHGEVPEDEPADKPALPRIPDDCQREPARGQSEDAAHVKVHLD